MSSRLNWSTAMSSTILIILIALVALACTFGLCEWAASRWTHYRGDDDSTLG